MSLETSVRSLSVFTGGRFAAIFLAATTYLLLLAAASAARTAARDEERGPAWSDGGLSPDQAAAQAVKGPPGQTVASSAPPPATGTSKHGAAFPCAGTVSFLDPESRSSAGGLLALTLEVKYADKYIGGDRVHLRSYDGQLVGPTLRLRPRDVLRVHLVNSLNPDPPHTGNINQPHGFNTTNLHTHGLHISPEDYHDNVYLEVEGQSQANYVLPIEDGHPSGTFWYHAHKHGSTAVQVSSGMAGALIIEGGLDEVPEIRAAKEHVFVFQQIAYDSSGVIEGRTGFDNIGRWPNITGTPRQTTVNGQLRPVLELAPGEVQRWRFIDAGIAESLTLGLEKESTGETLSFHEIAEDGLALGTILDLDQIDLHPGYRSDVLIKAPEQPGNYCLVDRAQPAAATLRGVAKAKSVVAAVVVQGKPRAMSLPQPAQLTQFVPFPDITSVSRERKFILSDLNNRPVVNNDAFDPDATGQVLYVEDAEEWLVSGLGNPHSFHIHVNPIQVLRREPKTGKALVNPQTGKELWVWKDTILVPSGGPPDTVRLRTRFTKYLGKTVLHCHRLDHEDRGMMQVVRLVPKNPGRGSGLTLGFPSLPTRAPAWSLNDTSGRPRTFSAAGGRQLLVFFRGTRCPHCLTQLNAIAEHFAEFKSKGVSVVAIGTDPPDDWQARAEFPFPVMCDPACEAFRAYHCFSEEPKHGLYLVEATTVVGQHISEDAITDAAAILDFCNRGVRP